MSEDSCINPGKAKGHSAVRAGNKKGVKVQANGNRPCHSFTNSGKRPPKDLCWEEDPRGQTDCTILLDSEGSVLKDSEGLILVHCEAEE